MNQDLDICFFCHRPIETNAYQIEGKWLHEGSCLEKASGLKLEKLLERKLIEGETIVYSNGTKRWFKNGKQHRDNDRPAVIYSDGTKLWYKDGQRHRDNDNPAVIYSDGAKYWFKDGKEYYPKEAK